MSVIKKMDHSQYQKDLKKKDFDALVHIIQDAKEAIKAMPDNPNAGYYADEISYCSMEIAKRRDTRAFSIKAIAA